MKVFKRVLLVLAILLLGGVVFCVVGVRKLHTAPSYYKPVAFSDQELQEKADQGEKTYLRMQQMVADAQAREKREAIAEGQVSQTSTSRPAGHPNAQEFVLSEDELNAALLKWSAQYKDKYGPYVDEPRLVLEEGKIILVGQLKQGGDTILSIHIAPTLDAKGQLLLDIDSIRGGTMPLPQVFFAKYQKQLEDWLHSKLAAWQSAAQMDPSGAANGDAVAASTGKLLLNMLHHEASPAVLFLKSPGGGKSPPARLTRVVVEDHKLKLDLEPMNAPERAELLQKIREPYANAIAKG